MAFFEKKIIKDFFEVKLTIKNAFTFYKSEDQIL